MNWSIIILLLGLLLVAKGEQLIYFIFTPNCYQTYFVDNTYADSQCFKAVSNFAYVDFA